MGKKVVTRELASSFCGMGFFYALTAEGRPGGASGTPKQQSSGTAMDSAELKMKGEER